MKVIINKFVMLAAGFMMCSISFAQDAGVLDGVYTYKLEFMDNHSKKKQEITGHVNVIK